MLPFICYYFYLSPAHVSFFPPNFLLKLSSTIPKTPPQFLFHIIIYFLQNEFLWKKILIFKHNKQVDEGKRLGQFQNNRIKELFKNLFLLQISLKCSVPYTITCNNSWLHSKNNYSFLFFEIFCMIEKCTFFTWTPFIRNHGPRKEYYHMNCKHLSKMRNPSD